MVEGWKKLTALSLSCFLGGCGDDSVPDDADVGAGSADAGSADAGSADAGGAACSPVGEGIDPARFLADGLNSAVAEVDCTLADGTASTCYRIEYGGSPLNHAVGPFCPVTVDDGPEAGGKWPDRGQLWDLDGAFIMNLATFYDDPGWQMWDPETRLVNRASTPEECQQAAQLGSGVLNVCIDCSLEALGGAVVIEALIPKVPVAGAAPTEIGNNNVGVSLSGVRIDFPAGVDIIKSEYQIAALDDCGGHVNNAVGYHYHESTGCLSEAETCPDHAALIGYAMDGYAIHTMRDPSGDEPADLDGCRGHADETHGYHYHAAGEGENMFIGCFRGTLAENNNGGPGGPGGGGGGPGGGGPGGGG